MADILCRWRNASIKQALEFSAIFPESQVSKENGRSIVIERWNVIYGKTDFFTTPYQLAAQMGIYYEDENSMFSRFRQPIKVAQAIDYMDYWGKHYYAPNPYTKSMDMSKQPIVLNNYLVNWFLEHEEAKLSEALATAFPKESLGNLDIITNMLNSFSDVDIKDDIITLKASAPKEKFSSVTLDVKSEDKKAFFEYVGKDGHTTGKMSTPDNPGFNKLFYGAPGTGKSYTVDNDYVKNSKSFRITFHPDTDYAGFVGCYKPTMGGEAGDRITYDFVPQVFLKAYVEAWKLNRSGEPVYLVIEELNRGNCAQIFGDVFQLLDRQLEGHPGYSKYIINVDSDIARHLEKELADVKEEYEEDIRVIYNPKEFDFSIMALPDNLYILATMNTSDQSLFPIDSAFKRRWEMEYVSVNYKDAAQFTVHINDAHEYNWANLLAGLNSYIKRVNHSTNKIIGNRFIQTKKDKIIDADTFRDKVLFFLFNDVFKDNDDFKSDFFGEDSENMYFEDLCEKDSEKYIIGFIENETMCNVRNLKASDTKEVTLSESAEE